MSSTLPAIARLVPAAASSPSDAAANAAPGAALAAPHPHPRESDCDPLPPPEDAAQRWSRAKQVAFLRHLAASHSVAAAARSVGMSRQSAYRLRARLKGPPFDRAWAAAFDCAFNALAHAAMERAIHGVEQPYFHNGELIHVGRRFDERLTLGLLRMRAEMLPLELGDPVSDAAAYEPGDFPALVDRVANGGETWGDA